MHRIFLVYVTKLLLWIKKSTRYKRTGALTIKLNQTCYLTTTIFNVFFALFETIAVKYIPASKLEASTFKVVIPAAIWPLKTVATTLPVMS